MSSNVQALKLLLNTQNQKNLRKKREEFIEKNRLRPKKNSQE